MVKSRWARALLPTVIMAGALACVPAASAATSAANYVGFNHLASLGLSSSASGTAPKSSDAESTNWSGYVATGAAPYKSVSSSWLQPSVSCSTTPNSYAAFWAGIDGDSSSTVEQDGTLAECVGNRAEYSAWYETYPNPMYTFGGTVKAGDLLTATVVANSTTSFTLTLTDKPVSGTGWSASTTQTVSSPAALSSAEVIAEAPSSNYGILPLADFGTASFESPLLGTTPLSAATGLTPIEMVTQSGQAEAIPSAISSSGFTVAWQAVSSRRFRF
jgi:Peptidase A4 family